MLGGIVGAIDNNSNVLFSLFFVGMTCTICVYTIYPEILQTFCVTEYPLINHGPVYTWLFIIAFS